MTELNRRIPLVRLFAEGTVIVLSILLAFSIDAWWDRTQERTKEDSYLRQLADDMESTLANNALFGARADTVDRAVARLVRAYYDAQSPSVDSLATWLSMAEDWWVVQARLGTVEALVATGDLALIRDDSLRAAIPNYLADMLAFEGFEDDEARRFHQAADELSEHVDLLQVRLLTIPATTRDSLAGNNPITPFPSGALRTLPAIEVVAVLRDPEVHQILVRILSAKSRMKVNRERMRIFSEGFLARVKSAQTS